MLFNDFTSSENFTINAIDGLAPKAELGKLGLKRAEMPKLNKSSILSTKLFGRQDFDELESNRTSR